jgi:acyl-CoA synthetase (AMP-forming)/AMP-acid ligase II
MQNRKLNMSNSHPSSTSHHPQSSILAFISTADLATFDDAHFNNLAINLFHYQFQHNPVYGRFCEQGAPAGTNPASWHEIPAVTTSAFKYVPLACFPPEDARAVFHTSGTTVQRSGKHYFRSLEFYRAAMLRSFRGYCLPDCEKMRLLFLGPTAELFPNSSLGYMFSTLGDEFALAGSGVFFTPESLLLEDFFDAVRRAKQERETVFILGTAFSLVQCVDEMQSVLQLPLPAGSRILDTGGYKGRTREVVRTEFQKMLAEAFEVPKHYLLNEYGMTELSSQLYESQLPGAPLQGEQPGIKFMPPWMRVVAVNPETLQPLPEGELGMLRIFDLANVDSVLAIQTEDLGRAWRNRIELAGRASGAELRGCSLLTEMIAWLSAS